MFRDLWGRLFAPKVFGCGCGKWYRDEDGLSRCAWRHALDPNA